MIQEFHEMKTVGIIRNLSPNPTLYFILYRYYYDLRHKVLKVLNSERIKESVQREREF